MSEEINGDRLQRVRLLGYARESLRVIEDYIVNENDGTAPSMLATEIETVRTLIGFYESIERRGTPDKEAAPARFVQIACGADDGFFALDSDGVVWVYDQRHEPTWTAFYTSRSERTSRQRGDQR